jgi:formylglycine-generating enzyme required for sulfatase activity
MARVPGGVFRAAGQWVSVGPFVIDLREVTAVAYRRCVTAGVCAAAPDPYGQMAAGATAPVVNVTWAMAARYCGWTGGRLPTEHEWELAARGVDGRRHPWGERAPDCGLARHAGCGDGALQVGTHPAGRSPFGLFDMAGNVAEWTADRFGPRGGREARGGLRDPVGAARGSQRVVRGGSFVSMPSDLSLDARRAVDEREARADVGFRCARGL